MATVNAWGLPAAAAPVSTAEATEAMAPSPKAKQPSLQEIMDEEFARRLYEEEYRAMQIQEWRTENPELVAKPYANLKAHDDEQTERAWLNADSTVQDGDDLEDEELARQFGTQATVTPATSAAAAAPGSGNKSKTQRFDRSLPFDGDDNRVFTGIRESFRKWEKDSRHGTGGGRVEAAKFATRDRVMDEKTTLLMQKLINRGDLDAIHGCIQTGKEANVYHAIGTDEETLLQREYAVKIFKTTLNEFSNRADYVLGDGRFDLAYHKKSAQRQLREWTEKEFRNLSRAVKYVRVPTPITFKEHILVMTFIGKDGWSAPTLKEATLSSKQLMEAYIDVLQSVRKLYQDARLVHGDLSEYNILYFNRQCWLIDFGQAVDHNHPEYFTYLQRDLLNVRQFFERSGVVEASADAIGLIPVETSFEFVTSEDPASVLAAYPALQRVLVPGSAVASVQ